MGILNKIIRKLSVIRSKRQSLISYRAAKILISRFGGNTGHNFDLGKNNDLGYGLIHYALITNLKPKRVLCVGSGKGFIPAMCAMACKANGFGYVDFVDAGYGKKNPNSWGGTGFWKRVDTQKHFGYFDLNRFISTYIMTSKDFSKLGTERKWQYIYIDADHSLKGVTEDFTTFWPRLETGGFMVFHDVLLKKHPKSAGFGVWKFWNNLKGVNKITIPFTLPWGIPSGLGIIQKT